MKDKIRILFIFMLFLPLSSCLNKTPYEVKSPCVSSDGGEFEITPCKKRPANFAIS